MENSTLLQKLIEAAPPDTKLEITVEELASLINGGTTQVVKAAHRIEKDVRKELIQEDAKLKREGWVPVPTAGKETGIPGTRLYNWVAENKIPSKRAAFGAGKGIRVRVQDVKLFISTNTTNNNNNNNSANKVYTIARIAKDLNITTNGARDIVKRFKLPYHKLKSRSHALQIDAAAYHATLPAIKARITRKKIV